MPLLSTVATTQSEPINALARAETTDSPEIRSEHLGNVPHEASPKPVTPQAPMSSGEPEACDLQWDVLQPQTVTSRKRKRLNPNESDPAANHKAKSPVIIPPTISTGELGENSIFRVVKQMSILRLGDSS